MLAFIIVMMGVRKSSGAISIDREHVKVPTNTFTHDIVLHPMCLAAADKRQCAACAAAMAQHT